MSDDGETGDVAAMAVDPPAADNGSDAGSDGAGSDGDRDDSVVASTGGAGDDGSESSDDIGRPRKRRKKRSGLVDSDDEDDTAASERTAGDGGGSGGGDDGSGSASGGSGSSDGVGGGSRRRRRKRDAVEALFDDDKQLDDEDYELMRENLGIDVQSKRKGGLRRLRRGRGGAAGSGADGSGELQSMDAASTGEAATPGGDDGRLAPRFGLDENDVLDDDLDIFQSKAGDAAASAAAAAAAGNAKAALDDILSSSDSVDFDASDDDLSDFIVDEDDPDLVLGPDGLPVRRKKKKKRKRKRKRGADGLTGEQLTDIADIFGGLDFLDAFESDESDGAADGEPRQTVGRPRGKKKAIGDDGGDEDLIFDAFEPGELAEAQLTEADDIVRVKDWPERYQLRFGDRPAPEEGELQREAEWICNLSFSRLERPEEAQGAIQTVLEFIRVRGFEVPYIGEYKRDEIGDLSPNDLWRVYDGDVKWAHMYNAKGAVKRMIATVEATGAEVPDFFGQLLESAQTEEEVADLREAFRLQFVRELTRGSEAEERSATAAGRAAAAVFGVPDELAEVPTAALVMPTLDGLGGGDDDDDDKDYTDADFKADEAKAKAEEAEELAELGLPAPGGGSTAADPVDMDAVATPDAGDGDGDGDGNTGASGGEDETENDEVEVKVEDEEEHTALPVRPRLKAPLPRNEYTKFTTATNILEFCKHVGLSAEDFGYNLYYKTSANSVVDYPDDPYTLADQFVSEAGSRAAKKFGDAETMVKAAETVIAKQLASDPNVRNAMRPKFLRDAVLSTSPTSRGKRMIDSMHVFAGIKYLRDKPVYDVNTKMWLDLKAAYDQNLIRLSISVPIVVHESTVADMRRFYLSAPDPDNPSMEEHVLLWDEFRERVLDRMLKRHLYPLFERETLKAGVRNAHRTIAMEYSDVLAERLDMAGWKLDAPPPNEYDDYDDYDDMDRQVRVLSIAAFDRRSPVTCVLVDKDGELLDFIKLDSFLLPGRRPGEAEQKEADVATFKRFLAEKRPCVIAVAAAGLHTRTIVREIEELANECKQEGNLNKYCKAIELVRDDVSRIYANSKRGRKEFPKHSYDARRAISLARYLLDPLAETAALCSAPGWPELHALKIHDLQDKVPRAELARAAERVFIDMVQHTGVDINRAARHPWAESTLQFVAGLGSRKAAAILANVRRDRGLQSRERLVRNYKMATVIYMNCAGFIRINADYLPEEVGEIVASLDTTRIHPADYRLAGKICADALELNDEAMNDQLEAYADDVIADPSVLEVLDLRSYAEELERRQRGRKGTILAMIKRELTRPFRERRRDWEWPERSALFTWITGETERSLRSTQQYARVAKTMEYGYSCRLENDIYAWLPRAEHTDPNANLEPGTILGCVVTNVDFENLKVTVATRPEYMEGLARDQMRRDEYYDRAAEDRDKRARDAKRRNRKYIKRVITHPSFRNKTLKQTLEELDAEEAGEALFRPSSKGLNNLWLTLKVTDGIYTHIDVHEADKLNKVALGKVLTIDGQKFEDLDHIMAVYVDPLNGFLREMEAHKYFRHLDQAGIDEALHREREKAPKRVPYLLSFSEKYPGKLVISYLPGKTPRHEYIKVSPRGYKFREQRFDNPQSLINYFKQVYKHPPPRKQPRREPQRTSSRDVPTAYGAYASDPRSRRSGSSRGGDPRDSRSSRDSRDSRGGGGGGGGNVPTTWDGGW